MLEQTKHLTAGKKDKYGSLNLIEEKPKKQKKKVMYESDDTSDENVIGYLLFLTGKNILTFLNGEVLNYYNTLDRNYCHCQPLIGSIPARN